MNDEYLRRPARDVDPDQLPDYGFGGDPLFRDEVPPTAGGPAFVRGDDPLSGSGSFATQGYATQGYAGERYAAEGYATEGYAPELQYGAGGDYGTGILGGGGVAGGRGEFGEGGEFRGAGEFGGAGDFGGAGRVPTPRLTDGRQAADIGPRGGFAGSGQSGSGHSGVGGVAGAGNSPGGGGGGGGGGGDIGGAAGAGGDQPAPAEGPLRVVPAEQASALLRIKLPDSPPVPATTLRGDAPIETVVEVSQMLHRVSPARPNALPGDVLALTTATMVVPMPGAAFGGRPAWQRPTVRLTASVPPDLASRAEADLLSDTVEQFFGDFDAIGRELKAQRAGGAAEAAGAGAAVAGARAAAGAGFGSGEVRADSAPPAPAAAPVGRYGVPTQFAGYDAARRSPVGMRYLGGIFHDSSGESSFYDPATESLVPMGAAAFSAADFRRISTSGVTPRPVPPPRTGPQTATPPRQSGAAAAGTASAAPGIAYGAGAAGSAGSAGSAVRTEGSGPAPRSAAGFAPGSAAGSSTRSAAGSAAASPAAAARPAARPAPSRDDDTAVLPTEHWSDHHPDHHRLRRAGRRRGRVLLVSAVATALVFGGVYAAALALEGQVPNGTVVDGVSIGGMSRAAAESKLAAALAPKLGAPLRLTANGSEFQLLPETAGLHVDYAGTVAAAASGRGDPLVALPALVGKGRDIPLKVTVDRVALRAALEKVTAGFDRTMVDGGVTFPGGVPTPIAPRPGRQVDLDAAVSAVAGAFDDGVESVHVAALSLKGTDRGGKQDPALLVPVAYAMPEKASEKVPVIVPSFPATPVTLVVHDVQPTVTPAIVAQAMQDLARPAMSGPVTLVTGTVKTVLKPAVLGRYLAIVPDGRGGLTPKLDGVGMRGEIDHDALAKLEQPPTDAAFTVTGGKPVLIPGKNGTGYAPTAIQNAVIPLLAKTASAQRVATVPFGPLPPALTTEAAQALGIRDVMGTYTAPFTASAQRTANVRRAASLVRGQIVQPGQTLSLNQVLGARTTANGFVPAETAAGGAEPGAAAAQDAGGGTSMVATALFNAEYLAGLKDVEHHPHAVVTDHFPPGMEAAVASPDVDLKFQNDSGAPVYLWAATTDNAVTVAVLGQKLYDSVQTEMSPHYAQVMPRTVNGGPGAGCVATEGVPGFQVDVTRILTKAGADPIRQVFHTAYAAQDKVVCGSGSGGSSAAGGATGGGAGSATTAGAGGTPGSPSAGSGATTSTQPSGSPTGGAAGGGTGGTGGATSPAPTGGAPGGGGNPGSATPPSAGWDGSLLGGLLGAPASKH